MLATTTALAQDARLLIIAPNALTAAAAEYRDARAADLRADVATLDEAISGQPGVDDAERLKHYLHSRWARSGRKLAYVLLMGDADCMPVRYMVLDRGTPAAFNYAFYPSDLYYADLVNASGEFDDWNAQKADFHAQYFGEVRGETNKSDPINYDNVDYRPDIAVGRWPVSTLDQARAVAAKSIAYERWATSPEAREMALVAVGGWIENRGMMDAVRDKANGSWRTRRLYWKDAARDDGEPTPSSANVLGLFGTCSVILHSGHGSEHSWEGCMSERDLQHLNNALHPAICMSAGCSTACIATLGPYESYIDTKGVQHAGTNNAEVFSAPPPPAACYQAGAFNHSGIGETLVRMPESGAAAYIGCDTGSQPCAMTLLSGFASALADSKADTRLGDCWNAALRAYWDSENLAKIKPTSDWYPPSVFFQGMKFVLLGDPSLRLPPRESQSPSSATPQTP